MVGKIIETKFLIYVNHNLYKEVKTFEELEDVEREIFSKHIGFTCVYGCSNSFSIYMNEKTKEAFTWWYILTQKTNLKDRNRKVVYVGDKLRCNTNNRNCWLQTINGELYIRFDGWMSVGSYIPDIRNVNDLSDFEVIKEIEKI